MLFSQVMLASLFYNNYHSDLNSNLDRNDICYFIQAFRHAFWLGTATNHD